MVPATIRLNRGRSDTMEVRGRVTSLGAGMSPTTTTFKVTNSFLGMAEEGMRPMETVRWAFSRTLITTRPEALETWFSMTARVGLSTTGSFIRNLPLLTIVSRCSALQNFPPWHKLKHVEEDPPGSDSDEEDDRAAPAPTMPAGDTGKSPRSGGSTQEWGQYGQQSLYSTSTWGQWPDTSMWRTSSLKAGSSNIGKRPAAQQKSGSR